MRNRLIVLPVFLALSLAASSQTAEELVQKNIAAKGGMEKIKAIKTLRLIGKLDAGGGFTAAVGQENKRPNLVRETLTLQGMTQLQAYDGSTGWQIRPFGGRKDPQFMGEDDVRDLLIDSDFDGPLDVACREVDMNQQRAARHRRPAIEQERNGEGLRPGGIYLDCSRIHHIDAV